MIGWNEHGFGWHVNNDGRSCCDYSPVENTSGSVRGFLPIEFGSFDSCHVIPWDNNPKALDIASPVGGVRTKVNWIGPSHNLRSVWQNANERSP